ncbi:hypothetical protein [Mesorhizobium sp. A623]
MPESERQRTERVLQELLAEKQVGEGGVEESRRSLLSGLFSKKSPVKSRPGGAAPRAKNSLAADWPSPPQAQFPKPKIKSDRRSDLVLAALGVTLGLICALFPWYIFYNDIRFSSHGFKLGGHGNRSGRMVMSDRPMGIVPDPSSDMSARNLDLFATGTPAERPEDPDKAPGLDQQPFPAEHTEFQLVHVANGRAMIEDNAGLWIVQPGSTLPDNSKVASIEQRGGKWVLVTSTNRVVALTK